VGTGFEKTVFTVVMEEEEEEKEREDGAGSTLFVSMGRPWDSRLDQLAH
jgi:hypothetical protein